MCIEGLQSLTWQHQITKKRMKGNIETGGIDSYTLRMVQGQDLERRALHQSQMGSQGALTCWDTWKGPLRNKSQLWQTQGRDGPHESSWDGPAQRGILSGSVDCPSAGPGARNPQLRFTRRVWFSHDWGTYLQLSPLEALGPFAKFTTKAAEGPPETRDTLDGPRVSQRREGTDQRRVVLPKVSHHHQWMHALMGFFSLQTTLPH